MFTDQDYYLDAPFDTSSDAPFLSADSDLGFYASSDWSSSLELPLLDSLPSFSDALTVAKDTSTHAVYPHANNELRLA
ncbi:hypothetical protein NUW54_g6801 [Trametes sanguinea]|uniref:Uncharacterized protein n=1 Tax=Trametes sanguinea TaxID=158606 RepID=A0ACC1PS87_9APHY|nr:hypothetical protein NUW54_g6801 [Trametes sanguinea]